MDEEEDFFNDDILNDDLLEALVKEESQYLNTQSNRENDTTNAITNIDPLYKERQQFTKAFSSNGNTATIREPENDIRSNWEPMDISDHGLSQQQENNIIKLQSIIERLESRLVQEELDHRLAMQKMNNMKTTLVFKEQELESMRAELKESKKKIQPNQKEWMDIDQENTIITNNNNISNHNINTNDNKNATTSNINDSESTVHRKNHFPSVSEFNIIPRQKRQRTISTSPSMSPSPFIKEPSAIRESSFAPSIIKESSITPSAIREPSAAPSIVMRESSVSLEQESLEQKQRYENTKASVDRAVKKALSNQQEKILKKIESKRLHNEQQEIQDFYDCVLTIKYLANTHEDIVIQKPIQLSLMTDVCDKLTKKLRPSKILTEGDSKLNSLVTDLSDCILRANGVTVKSTLVQLIDIIKLIIKLCVSEKKNLIFYHVIQILNALVMGYKELPTSLYQEMIRYNEESILYSLVKGLTLVPLDNNNGQTNKSHIIFALPDLKTVKAKDINIILKEYQFGQSDKRQLLTDITFSQAQETVVTILDTISYVCCTHMVSAERFLFLLDQYEFTSLISTRKPYSTSIKALALLNLLTVYGSTKWLYDEKYRPILKMVASFMVIPRPSDVLEVQWYKARILSIAICETFMTSVPTPLTIDDAFELVFTPLLYILNNECLCIQNTNKPPYHSVPTKESDKLIIDTILLMSKTLDVYPDILVCEDGDVYVQTLSALKGASTIINEKWPLDHEVTLKFREIGKLLHIRQKTIMES